MSKGDIQKQQKIYENKIRIFRAVRTRKWLQGSALLPTLFKVVVDKIMRKLATRIGKEKMKLDVCKLFNDTGA